MSVCKSQSPLCTLTLLTSFPPPAAYAINAVTPKYKSTITPSTIR